ncbi:MAG TPA: DUF4974 domain-containing protein [Bacteroidales bacterium]|nr:DUF4974 domain-containing protein [Bacteroidales bacterium]HPT22182.1 DUF4974 domain-containing protein [Bacteroidales bacterium]
MTEVGFDGERIRKFFRGDYSGKDELYVNELFNDKNNEAKLKVFLSKQFEEMPKDDDTDTKDLDHILYRIHYDINSKMPVQKEGTFDKVIKWTLRISATILLPIFIFFGVKNYQDNRLKKDTWVEIKAPAWTRAQFSLPDGSTGWLNSNSSLKYSGSFVSDRKVALNGEAFFDVAKDPKRPFVVSTKDVFVEVLGTRFNIASYENEKNVEVVLEEGKLVFNNTERTKSYTMSPNDLVVYDKTSKICSTEVVQPHKYSSWKEGKLVFRNDPLDVIARRLERWYNIDVEIKTNLSEDLRLRATFIDEDLEEVLNLLKCSLPIDYTIENRDLKPDETFARKRVIITKRNK